jgi:YD repeat-containing protein
MQSESRTSRSAVLRVGLATLGLAALVPTLLQAQSSSMQVQVPGRGRATPQVASSSTYDYVYDALGRLTQVTYPGGTTLTYSYDTRSNVTDITVLP